MIRSLFCGYKRLRSCIENFFQILMLEFEAYELENKIFSELNFRPEDILDLIDRIFSKANMEPYI
ncbi:MAG: hypothetical protein JRI72_17200 [Deltaproteobacteria bacterium]|nr:hypothetical protein [Deltaproteobacteria bacterium]